MLKVLLFDLDGTLLDTLGDIAQSLNKTLTKFGFKNYTNEEVKTFIGHAAKVFVARALGNNYSEELFNEFFKIYMDDYYLNKYDKTIIYPALESVLKSLGQKYRLGVITNKKYIDAKELINHYFPDTFSYIWGVSDQNYRKPQKEVLDEALNFFNVDKDEVIYIGDSEVDAQFGENANIKYLLCRYGYENREKLEKYNPMFFIDKSSDLLELLE